MKISKSAHVKIFEGHDIMTCHGIQWSLTREVSLVQFELRLERAEGLQATDEGVRSWEPFAAFFNFFFQSLGFGWRFLFFANLVISYSCCPGVEVQTLQGVMQKSLVAQTCHRFLDGPELKTRISKVQHSVQQLMPKHHWMLAVWLWPQSLPEFSEDIQESNRDTPIFGLKCYKMI